MAPGRKELAWIEVMQIKNYILLTIYTSIILALFLC